MVLEACSVLAVFRCAEVPGAFFELVVLEDEVFLFVMTDSDSDRLLVIARDDIGTSILLCSFEVSIDTEDAVFGKFDGEGVRRREYEEESEEREERNNDA